MNGDFSEQIMEQVSDNHRTFEGVLKRNAAASLVGSIVSFIVSSNISKTRERPCKKAGFARSTINQCFVFSFEW